MAVVTGAGPVGLLAALLGVQRGLDVHVFDKVTGGPKPELVRSLGATYHSEGLTGSGVKADVLVECAGVASVVMETVTCRVVDSVICLAGVSSTDRTEQVDVGSVNRSLVLGNESVFGRVNANRSHHEAAAKALEEADSGWLQRLITRRVAMAGFPDAFRRDSLDGRRRLPEAGLPWLAGYEKSSPVRTGDAAPVRAMRQSRAQPRKVSR